MFSSNVIQQGSVFLINFFIVSSLSKTDYGTFKLLFSILTYLTFTNLGLSQHLLFKLPKTFKLNKSASKITSIVHSYLIVIRPIIFLVFILFFFKKVTINNTTLYIEWFMVGLFFLLSGWNNLFQNIFKSASRFDLLTNTRIINTLFYLFPVTIFYYQGLLSINTILLSNVFSVFMTISYGFVHNKNYLFFNFNIKKIAKAMKFGIPITANTFIFNLTITSTLWMISFNMDSENTGVYGFALLISTIFKVFPGIIVNLINPKSISYIDINIKNNNKIYDFVISGINTFIFTNFVFMILAIIFFKIMIVYFFEEYNDAWLVSLCLIVGEYFLSLISFHGNYLILKGKINLIILVNIIILAIHISLSFILAKFVGDISFMGIPIMVSLILYSLFVQYVFQYLAGKGSILKSKTLSIIIKQSMLCIVAALFGLMLNGFFNFNINFIVITSVCIILSLSIKISSKGIIKLNELVN